MLSLWSKGLTAGHRGFVEAGVPTLASNCRNLMYRWRIRSLVAWLGNVFFDSEYPPWACIMIAVKSDIPIFPLLPPLLLIKHLITIILHFDMEQGKPSSLNPRRPRSASTSNLIQNHAAREQHTHGSGVSAQNTPLLAQSASAAGNLDQAHSSMLSQGYYPSIAPLPGFYGNFLHHDNMPPPQSVQPTSVNFPWHAPPPPPSPHSKRNTNQHNLPQASSSTNLHHDPGPLAFLDSRHGLLHLSDATTSNPTRGEQARVSAIAPHNSSSPEVELTEAERAAASDEKRRRNTAASARFRVKKKHRTIALERTVSDLTGRAEELEREVGDLRRENGWLKEIVMLKGTQNIVNNRLALRQAVALATSQRTSGSESTLQADASEGSSSGLSDDETPVKKSEGKQGSEGKKS